MRRLLVMLLSVVALSASAREKNGVTMPDTTTVEGKELKLNGLGQRTKVFFHVYVAGLYLETPSRDPAAIINSDQLKLVRMAMQRDLNKKQIAEAIEEGFKKNAGEKMPALRERLEKFIAQIPDIKNGESLVIAYVPGQGTIITNGAVKTVIPGKDFSEALFSVWLGKQPVDDDLKKGMLGAP